MQCIYIPSHNHTILLFMQKHEKLRPNSWSPALHCVSRTNSQHLRSPRQRCAGTNGDRRKGMIYQTLGIRCGWRTLVAGLKHWQQVMATQSTPAARGECDHPNARSWIACDQCSSWYHCLCVGVRHKKEETVDFTFYACIHHS